MSSCELGAWAASGAMALTGPPNGPPMLAPGSPAWTVAAHLAGLGLARPRLLGERAAIAGLQANAPWSCGGATRILPTADGKQLAISLARPADLDLVPALTEERPNDGDAAWQSLSEWVGRTSSGAAEDRLKLLGLPGRVVRSRSCAPTAPSLVAPDLRGILVVDLSALWAGPLCGSLLGDLGAEVIKVESVARPDGARFGPPAFFELLNRGKKQVTIDLPGDVDSLRSLLHAADVVIESSRPRALRQLGIDAEEFVQAGTTWVSITAEGRGSDAIGYGDDVAAGAGLIRWHDGVAVPVGDALADPLTGVVAATLVVAALRAPEPGLVDVAMIDVCASVLGPLEEHAVDGVDGAWTAECAHGTFPVRRPGACE